MKVVGSNPTPATKPCFPISLNAEYSRTRREWQSVLDKPFSSHVRAIDATTGETRWTADNEGWQDRFGMRATQAGLVVHGDLGGRLIVRTWKAAKC
ncbi:hypothetical protein [Aurantiacibacter flavus]|uniref:hypothetical protein n=1 Tax=Aurantiacibacter flavus TaxID=3145232 RepID=UPI003D1E4131